MSRGSAQRPDAGRRRFLQVVGLTAVASAVSSSMAAWPQARSSTTPAAAKPDSAAKAAEPPALSEEARALAGIVERRYGKHLTPPQLEAVTREIDGRVQGGKRLREQKLANHDEPDFVFRAG